MRAWLARPCLPARLAPLKGGTKRCSKCLDVIRRGNMAIRQLKAPHCRRARMLGMFALAWFATPAIAQELITAELGPCPEANEAEFSPFEIVPVPEPRIEELGPLSLGGIKVSTVAHSAEFFEGVGNAGKQFVEMAPTLQFRTTAPFRNLDVDYRPLECVLLSPVSKDLALCRVHLSLILTLCQQT